MSAPPPYRAERLPSPSSGSGSPVGPLRALLWLLPPAVAVLAGLHHGPFFIDDAYITFRYAENLAGGHGLVFNPGEPVLGTTTPLFATLLAGLKVLGASVPSSARWLGLLSMAGVVGILMGLARRSLSLPTASALGLCVALHPDAAFMGSSGMETAPSVALVLGGLLLSLQRRWLWAGVVGGAAVLMRPDGVLVVALALLWAARVEPRKLWQPLLAAAIVVAPWLVTASLTYGSALPHSIQAKQLIHPGVPTQTLLGHFGLLTENLPLTLLFVLGAIGSALALLRRSELALVVLWMGAYAAALATSGIAAQFPWYVTPLSITGVLLAAWGADQGLGLLLRRLPAARRGPTWLPRVAAPALLLLVAGLGLADTNWRGFRTDGEGREAAYLQIGAWLAARADPGDVVLVGEVGVLSYLLLDQVLVDSAGINSPEVFRFRSEEQAALRAAGAESPSPEGTWRWVTRTIKAVEADYVVTKYPWLHIGKVEELPWFMAQYARVGPDDGALSDYRIYERR